MSRFDEEPDGDPHGECAFEIRRLIRELQRQREISIAWKKEAEHQYGLLRSQGDSDEKDYPVEGALDVYARGKYPALRAPLAQPVHPADVSGELEISNAVVDRMAKITCQTCEALARTVMLDQTSHDQRGLYTQTQMNRYGQACFEEGNSAQPVQPAEPCAYSIYFPDQQKGELVYELDDVCEDMTNDENHVVTNLYDHPAIAQPVPPDTMTDTKRLDWLAIYGSFGVDSASGKLSCNGQQRRAATRKNIDAFLNPTPKGSP